MFNYLFITNTPDIAKYVEQCGVTRIFIDLEINGKEQRQGHLDTVISRHQMADVGAIKNVLEKAELMVRLNPLYEGTQQEIDKAIALGANIIMQPMFQSVEEVKEFGSMINGRAKFIPLVETVGGANDILLIDGLKCVDELHIGLNDLHLELGLDFMFEIISSGMIDKMLLGLQKPFGIGGIARVGEGIIPGEMVMAEHVRLGSTAVILSRAFHLGALNVEELNHHFDFSEELSKIETQRKVLLKADPGQLDKIHRDFVVGVESIVSKKNEKIF